jgi:L-malate glycosyltransferase
MSQSPTEDRRIPIVLASLFLEAGGSETQLRQTALALDRKRFDVHVVFFRPNEARQNELLAAGLHTRYWPLNSLTSGGTVKIALELRSYLRKHRIRLLHAFDNPSSIFAIPVARAAGVPVILSSQRGHPHLYRRALHRLQRLGEIFADGIVVNAEALRQHLIQEEHIPPERIRFCPNGLDTERFPFPATRQYPPELASARAVMGCISALRPEKHLPFLVDAFALMRRDRPGLKLLFVGSDHKRDRDSRSEREAILARIEAHGLHDDCLLVPYNQDVPRWMRAIDVFALCSETEGSSNSLLEAMASGAVVVGSRVPGTRELIQEGVNGFLFEFGDAADLSRKVLRLVDDPVLRQSVARSASSWVRENMSIASSAARMGAIYDEFLRMKLR